MSQPLRRLSRIVYVISGIDYALGFDWLDKHLDRTTYDPYFIFIGSVKPSLIPILKERGGSADFIRLNSKWELPLVFMRLLWIFLRFRPDIVHAHLLDANLTAIPAAWLLRIRQRIYTRHHSTYHFDYHPHMVKYDKLINRLSTRIASISEVVSKVLIDREGVPANKVFAVPHGFELERFFDPDPLKLAELRHKYNLDGHHPVVGVISRFTAWKGIQYIIPAFREIIRTYPNAKLVLANSKGDYKAQLMSMLSDIPEDAFVLVPFETDLFSFYHLFDIFVHVPVDKDAEAFGQTYVESLAAGIPSVFTLSGIANEFIRHEQNALVVPYKNSEAIAGAILKLMNDTMLANKLREMGRHDVNSRFAIGVMMKSLYKLYER